MGYRLGLVMDPLPGLDLKKDSTLAMVRAAQDRGWPVYYLTPGDLGLADGRCQATRRRLHIDLTQENWHHLGEPETGPLSELDLVLMRKDPPFDLDYIYATYLLEMAEAEGVCVVNRPASLRDCNEKLFTTRFPQCCPPLVVSSQASTLRAFIAEHRDAVLKPLHGMGGQAVFRVRHDDPNIGVIIETLTHHGRTYIMAQRYIPEIRDGDKRILMIDGEPVPFALARVPAKGESRGNLAAGGTGRAVPLSERDRWICSQVGPELVRRGLAFVGLDVIGDYLTEVNVTSPTCVRELDTQCGLDIGGQLLDRLAARLRDAPR